MKLLHTEIKKSMFIPCYEDGRDIVEGLTPRDFTSYIAFEIYKEDYYIARMRVIFEGWIKVSNKGEMATDISDGEHILSFPYDDEKQAVLNGKEVKYFKDLLSGGVKLKHRTLNP